MPDAGWVERRSILNRSIKGHFDTAMDRFFTKVDEERRKLNMSDFDVFHALEHIYGEDIAAEWQDWLSG